MVTANGNRRAANSENTERRTRLNPTFRMETTPRHTQTGNNKDRRNFTGQGFAYWVDVLSSAKYPLDPVSKALTFVVTIWVAAAKACWACSSETFSPS